jgi:hypothetical protein
VYRGRRTRRIRGARNQQTRSNPPPCLSHCRAGPASGRRLFRPTSTLHPAFDRASRRTSGCRKILDSNFRWHGTPQRFSRERRRLVRPDLSRPSLLRRAEMITRRRVWGRTSVSVREGKSVDAPGKEPICRACFEAWPQSPRRLDHPYATHTHRNHLGPPIPHWDGRGWARATF